MFSFMSNFGFCCFMSLSPCLYILNNFIHFPEKSIYSFGPGRAFLLHVVFHVDVIDSLATKKAHFKVPE